MTQLNEPPTESDFQPSASFRATMEAVTKGVTDEDKLREIATEGMRPAQLDPVPEPESEPEPQPEPEVPEKETPEPEPEPEPEVVEEPETPEESETPEEPEDDASARNALREKLAKESKADPAEEDELRGVKPTDPTRFQKRVNNYEKLLTEKDQALKAVETQLQELQGKIQQIETIGGPERLQEDLKELKQFRRRYAIERDPEFKERFETKFQESNEVIDEALAQVGVTQKLRDTIKEVGGVGAFLKSGIKVPVKGAKDPLTAGEFISRAMDAMKSQAPDAHAVFTAELAAQRKLENEKTKFLAAESAEAEKYFEEIEQREQQLAQLGEKAEEELNKVIGTFKTTVHSQDWMKDLAAPPDASEDIKNAIASENKFRRDLRQYFDLQVQIPAIREAAKRTANQEQADELARVIIDSARVFHVEREMKAEKARADALQKEIDAIRKGGRSTPNRRTTGGRATSPNPTGEPKRENFSTDLQYGIALNRWKVANGIPIEE